MSSASRSPFFVPGSGGGRDRVPRIKAFLPSLALFLIFLNPDEDSFTPRLRGPGDQRPRRVRSLAPVPRPPLNTRLACLVQCALWLATHIQRVLNHGSLDAYVNSIICEPPPHGIIRAAPAVRDRRLGGGCAAICTAASARHAVKAPHSWDEAVVRWLLETKHKASHDSER
jgi:hypothetical protein